MNLKIGHLMTSILLIASTGYAAEYKLDESHTQVGFKVKHLVISTVSGRFNKFVGSLNYDPKAKKIENLKVSVEANSIDTNEPERDKHLRSKDFFDVEKFKNITFASKETSFKDGNNFNLAGDLTIHGITKKVVLKVDFKGEVTDPWGNTKAAFEARSKVNRKDFGLNWNKNLDHGGVMIADDVEIIIEGEANLQKEAKK